MGLAQLSAELQRDIGCTESSSLRVSPPDKVMKFSPPQRHSQLYLCFAGAASMYWRMRSSKPKKKSTHNLIFLQPQLTFGAENEQSK